MVIKGSWVQIQNIILNPEQRTAKIPEDTRKVPLTMWLKGRLQEDAEIDQEVHVTTITGRTVVGILVDVNPAYTHGFGDTYVPELLDIDDQIRDIMRGGEHK